MAPVSPWWWAALGLSASVTVPLAVAGRGRSAGRFVAVQMLTTLATVILIVLSFALEQSSFMELPLALALLSATGTLLVALFLERWI